MIRSNKLGDNIIGHIIKYALLVITYSSLVACDTGPAEKAEVFKIGVLLPLTGPLAEYGARVKKGVDLAIDNINKSVDDNKVELIVMDSKAQPKIGISAFKQMVDMHGIHYVLGDVSSSVTLAIVPLLEQQKVLMLSPSASNHKLSNSSSLFARNWPVDRFEAGAVARYAINSGCKKIATIVVNVDYGIGLGDNFSATFEEEGGEVIFSDTFSLANKDYRTIWGKVAAAKPECIYFVGHKPEIMSAIAQYREAGITAQVYGNTNFEDAEILDVLGEGLEGVVYGTVTLDTSSTDKAISNFVKKYREKYSGGTPTIYSANGYDLLKLLFELQSQYGGDVHVAMKDLKSRKDIIGAAGTFRFLDSGDVDRPIAIRSVKNGKYVTLGHY